MDATTYLSAVNIEARSLPAINVSSSPPTQQKPSTENNNRENRRRRRQHNQSSSSFEDDLIEGTQLSLSLLLSNNTDLPPCPSPSLLPQPLEKASEWVDGTLHNFSNLRLYLEKCHGAGVGRSREEGGRVPVPPMKDAASWHEYCLGKSEAEGNTGGYFDDDDDDDDEDETSSSSEDEADETVPPTTSTSQEKTSDGSSDGSSDGESSDDDSSGDDDDDDEEEEECFDGMEDAEVEERGCEWMSNIPREGHLPTTKLLLQMDQVMTRRVLLHHIDYICDGWCLTEKRLAWVYALLARLEKPLHRDDDALLRRFLRECCRERAKMTERGKVLASLNVIIAIVGVYFEQGTRVMEVG
eukprot:CAMPEP_0172520214 /NCGR_PEP_ID=MMETSP1066-20121228/291874_1 /TAXON_ID=671091 /ORGANISM="Coscinodiscus wailesii, Strain CCMP2513" /LENGTH=354 /DNA_ID=CAMNT_0013302935 /DNA_START=74 /DNA_END=1139 /DNA_ORIENTATION=-